jgi:hypothetical protein
MTAERLQPERRPPTGGFMASVPPFGERRLEHWSGAALRGARPESIGHAAGARRG